MAKYQELWFAPGDSTLVGYLDTETGKEIPLDDGNAAYRAVLKWIAAGNVADPNFSPEEIADDAAAETLAATKAAIKARDLKLFEMLLALWDILKTKGVVVNTDLSEDLRNEAVVWKSYLDQING